MLGHFDAAFDAHVLAAAPATFAGRRRVSLAFGPQRLLRIGEVLSAQVREGLVDPLRFNSILRPWRRSAVCGTSYARQRDGFALKPISYGDWRAGRRKYPA